MNLASADALAENALPAIIAKIINLVLLSVVLGLDLLFSLRTCNFSLLALLLLATVVFAIGRPHVESNLHVSPCALGRTLHSGDGDEW